MGKVYALSFWWKFSVSLLAPLSLHAPGLENRVVNEIDQNKKIMENYMHSDTIKKIENLHDSINFKNYGLIRDGVYLNREFLPDSNYK